VRRGGVLGGWLAGALRARERAVILPAVQSLRRAGSEGENGEGVSREGAKGLGQEWRLGRTPEGQGDLALGGSFDSRGNERTDNLRFQRAEVTGKLEDK
jgi:hypothetical protein